MRRKDIGHWEHKHVFGQDEMMAGEKSTVVVAVMTAAMMVVEVAGGIAFGSMALLADGLHMASHAVALGINVLAYVYTRRHAADKRFSFGTGKVNALGGFTGAILLGVVAAFMVWESAARLIQPVSIAFNEAILIAVIGFIVNGVSVFILNVKAEEYRQGHEHEGGMRRHAGHHDHNLRSAYLHVLADALTSVLAIAALLAAKYLGLIRMDALMGIVGAAVICRWAAGLLRQTSGVLLDKEGPERIRERIKEDIEREGDCRISDLHVWSVGPNIWSAIVSVVAMEPLEPQEYKKRIRAELGLEHVTVEAHRWREPHC